MSYGLVFGALLVILLLGGFVGGLVWWVRRPVASRRYENDVLPLFGHDRAVVYARAEDEGADEDDNAQLIVARAPNRPTVGNGTAPTAGNGTEPTAPATGNAGGLRDVGRPSPQSARTPSPGWSTPISRTGYAPMPGGATPADAFPGVPMPGPSTPRTSISGASASDFAKPDAFSYDGPSIRYSVPTDSTLQFLPGRLEIIGGPDLGRDVRFVRTPGRDVIEVTFGRNEGPPYRHVQLHDATVSRAHARMRYRDGQWLLSNLSTTNPVLHNGVVVVSGADLPLAEGDRIEMGEVVFRFHL